MSTIGKVAERAGVSRTTVSHVLNHADRVSKPLRERVQSAIDELGYVPNPQAQSLRTGRTKLIGMLIPDIRNPFYPELVKTAQSALERVGLDMLIFNTDVPGGHPEQHGREYLRQLRHKRVDGLIIGAPALHGMNEALATLEMPAVFVGNLASGEVDSVWLDDFGGARQMGAYIGGKGHRRVAHVTGPAIFPDAVLRREGFEAGFAAAGGSPDASLRFEGTYLEPSGRQAVAWLLEKHGDALPSAIFFANYLMALGAMAEFYDRGIRVPGDIAVAMFDDLPQLEYLRPRLTRVGVGPSALAERAIAMLVNRLNDKGEGPARGEIVACQLMEFESL